MECITLEKMVTDRVKMYKMQDTYFLRDKEKPLNTVGYIKIYGSACCATINIVISPEYRKKGYATEVINATLVWLFLVDEVKQLDIVMNSGNYVAASLALKFGFTPTDKLISVTNFRHYTLPGYRWLIHRNGGD